MSRYALSQLDDSALKQSYNVLKRTVKARLKTFEKHNALNAISSKYRQMPSVRDLTKTELLNLISDTTNFLGGEKGTYKRYQEQRKRLMEDAQQRLGDSFQFKNDAEYEEYLRFMGAMQERVGVAVWSNKASGDGEELYAQAKRLNINPMQFVKNYDYWMEHVDKLEKAVPVKSRNAKPSTYAKQLHLPKIKGNGNY